MALDRSIAVRNLSMRARDQEVTSPVPSGPLLLTTSSSSEQKKTNEKKKRYLEDVGTPDTPTYRLLLEMEDGMLSISNKR